MIHRGILAALVTVIGGLAMTSSTHAEVQSKELDYAQGGATLKGYLAADDAKIQGKVPGVVVVPEWWGLNDYSKRRARQLAELGYVALGADVYGDGVNTSNPKEAGPLATKFKSDRALLRARVQAAVDTLKNDPRVDPKRVAVIGYCFGGTASLEIARSGADIAAVVSIHGGLDSLHPVEAKKIKAKVLVLHGADDPTMKPEDIAAFQDEMRKAHVDWQMIYYGNAVHAFSNPDVDKLGMPAIRYNKAADERSWAHMVMFFKEVFGQ